MVGTWYSLLDVVGGYQCFGRRKIGLKLSDLPEII